MPGQTHKGKRMLHELANPENTDSINNPCEVGLRRVALLIAAFFPPVENFGKNRKQD